MERHNSLLIESADIPYCQHRGQSAFCLGPEVIRSPAFQSEATIPKSSGDRALIFGHGLDIFDWPLREITTLSREVRVQVQLQNSSWKMLHSVSLSIPIPLCSPAFISCEQWLTVTAQIRTQFNLKHSQSPHWKLAAVLLICWWELADSQNQDVFQFSVFLFDTSSLGDFQMES